MGTLALSLAILLVPVIHRGNAVDQQLSRLVSPGIRAALLPNLAEAFMSTNASCVCQRHASLAVSAARDGQLWALKMVDASARTPPGLLQGNVNQFGDFDECLSLQQSVIQSAQLSKHRHQNIPNCPPKSIENDFSSTYCLSSVELRIPDSSRVGQQVELISQLLHSYTPFRSNFSDPGHRVPRFSAAHLAACIPSSCSSLELQVALEKVLNDALDSGDQVGKNNPNRISLGVFVSPKLCRSADRVPEEDGAGARIARILFLIVLMVVAAATAIEVILPEDSKSSNNIRALLCFSLQHNWRALIRTDRKSDDIECLHGVRGLSAFGLLLSHKAVALLYNPYINRTPASLVLGMPWSIIGRAAILYTDCFILLSGVLAAKSILQQLERSGKVTYLKRMFDRYVRFTPTLVAVIIWCTLFLPELGRGPLWGLVIDPHAALCRQNWWRNILYIHNYYGFEKMCLTHTHQLGIDMQLFLVAPFLVIPLWRWPKAGLLFLGLLAAASTLLRYVVVLQNQLSTIVFFGVSVTQMFRTANLSYILPTHRLTVYIMGVVLGYALHRVPSTFSFSRLQALLGWFLFISLGLVSVLGIHHKAVPGFTYDAQEAALYAAFAPITWSAFVCWGVFACATGAGGPMNDLLCWKGFAIFTRLAYAVYLTQFPVFFYNVGSTRHADFYGFGHLLDFGEFTVVMAASIVLTLTFDLPFQELKKVLSSKPRLSKTAQCNILPQNDTKVVSKPNGTKIKDS